MQVNELRRVGDYLADPEHLPPRILVAEDDADLRALVCGDLRRTPATAWVPSPFSRSPSRSRTS
jgi:hypothetical protein